LNTLIEFSADQRKMAHGAKMEVDISTKRRNDRMERIAAEERMQKQLEESSRKARHEEIVYHQNRQIAGELERQRIERERKEREIQRICEESEELKELERHLKVAYMNKERAAQHEEKVVLTRMEREQNQAIDDAMEHDRQYLVAAEMEKERARRLVTLEQKSVLQVQMREREELLAQAKLEAIKDKAMVDEIVSKIEAEDQRDYAERERRKAETRGVIKAYEVQRKQEKLDKAANEAAAEAEIKKHIDAVAAREDGVAALRADKERAEAAAFASIAAQVERARLEEEEMNRLRDLLWEEELEAARRAQDVAKKEAKAKARDEMALANKQMLAAKQLNRELAAEEEARLVALMMKKFAEDEENERLGEMRRAANREKFKGEIKEQRQLRLELYAKERDAELENVAYDKELEGYKAAVVNEARRRLLAAHAERLHGYLPKGALANHDEHSVFRQAAGPGSAMGATQGAQGAASSTMGRTMQGTMQSQQAGYQ